MVMDSLFQRIDQGGEFQQSLLRVDGSHWTDLGDDDDNDGIYFKGHFRDIRSHSLSWYAVQPFDPRVQFQGFSRQLARYMPHSQFSYVRDSVFVRGHDDAIDHCSGDLVIERVHIREWDNEGIATSTGCRPFGTPWGHQNVDEGQDSRVLIMDSSISHCDQGIEVGYGSPQVTVLHSEVMSCNVGVRFGDDYAKTYGGSANVRYTFLNKNGRVTDQWIWLVKDQVKQPVEGQISVRCSHIGPFPSGDLPSCVANMSQKFDISKDFHARVLDETHGAWWHVHMGDQWRYLDSGVFFVGEMHKLPEDERAMRFQIDIVDDQNDHAEDRSARGMVMSHILDTLLCAGLTEPTTGALLDGHTLPEDWAKGILHTMTPPFIAAVRTMDPHDGQYSKTSFSDLVANRDMYQNWGEYLLFLYLANCNAFSGDHFALEPRMTGQQDDNSWTPAHLDPKLVVRKAQGCFLRESALQKQGVSPQTRADITTLSDLIFSHQCELFHVAKGIQISNFINY